MHCFPHKLGRRSGFSLRALGFFLLVLGGTIADGQSLPASPHATYGGRDTILVALIGPDSLYRLKHQFIVQGTDSVFSSKGIRFLPGVDYSLDRRYGTLRIDTSYTRRQTLPPGAAIIVVYRYLPLVFQDSYYLRKLTSIRDTVSRKDSLRIERPLSRYTVEDLFGPNLQKSGTLVRGLTVGSNRDLSLNSGLRLQLSGRLTNDLDVTAALTDENTPLQPEGTTQTLQEFDKVFVTVKGKNLSGTLGDFVLDLQGTEFGRLTRKLQGAQISGDLRDENATGSLTVAGAVSRGKFNTLQFTGIEGVQGPYRLAGRNGERAIIVIAGTERVYINGERQTRGESNDYVIDYSTAELTFTSRRLVTSVSRITVDFEYTDRQYSRSLFATQATASLFSDKVGLSLGYFREADNPDAPIDLVLSDTVRAVIAAAGADRSQAVLTGVTRADSNGFYQRVDTLVQGSAVSFYRYAPGSPGAVYNVTFSFVGSGKGDYTRRQAGIFQWVGVGLGEYLPLRYLPLPEMQQVLDAKIDIRPAPEARITGEFAHSTSDLNRLSVVPGNRRDGDAFTISGSFSPKDITLGGANIGSLELTAKARRIGQQFVSMDRTNEIEFNRRWGIDTVQSEREDLFESALRYRPVKGMEMSGSYGSIDRSGGLTSSRWDAGVQLNRENLPRTDYFIERIRTRDLRLNSLSIWLRQHGSMGVEWGPIAPRLRYEAEDRSFQDPASGAVREGSFRFDEIGPGVVLKELGKFSASADFGFRNEKAWKAGSVIPQARSFTQTYSAKLTEWNDLSSILDVALRKKTFTPDFQGVGNSNTKSLLVRSQVRYTPFGRALESDLFYEVATQQSSRLERVFVRVTKGTGTYQYLGDLNGNGIADENEFVQTRFDGDYVPVTVPSDRLYPIIDLKTSARFRFTPSRILQGAAGTLAKILSALSTETYVRVDEKSTDENLSDIALLRFRRFQQDSTTLSGSRLFSQDLLLLDGHPSFSGRLRFLERKGMNNFSGGIERSYGNEKSARLRFKFVPEVAQQLDLALKKDRVTGQIASTRLRDISTGEVTFDISYRPEQRFELGLKIGSSTSTDHYTASPLDASLNTQAVRASYAFEGSGQARAEFSREEVIFRRVADQYPYELTGGRLPGKTWLWKAGFEYRLTSFLQSNIQYDGRSEGGGSVVHTARAEVRAFF
jgi:hypothetical protein